ncbi:polysaccharide export outer membrane protein [Pedobacter sp. CAN_A7]|uniref:polysaccharide biosynthesis/export family protein n=1 Tax=Pedobacter sp. CAN_A7 TaxID=2787722 RepID=UPI0018C9B5FA
MYKYRSQFLLIAGLLFLSACSSYNKIPYFQNINRSAPTRENISNFTALTIQNSDILDVSVNSLNPLAYNDSTTRIKGYLVDHNGEIKLPMIGKLKVTGLTTSVVGEQIEQKLLTYLSEPTVNVRILNFKIAVLGDVLKPDNYQVLNERITIMEALSLAGDLNITAKRNNIILIREIDGKREYIPMDISSSKIFQSPYYYLKNNDVIYVQPDKTKYATVDGSYRTFSLVLSALSIAAIILTNVL